MQDYFIFLGITLLFACLCFRPLPRRRRVPARIAASFVILLFLDYLLVGILKDLGYSEKGDSVDTVGLVVMFLVMAAMCVLGACMLIRDRPIRVAERLMKKEDFAGV